MKKSREERIKDLQAVNKYFKQHIGDSLEIYINGETKSFKLLETKLTLGIKTDWLVVSKFENNILGEIVIKLNASEKYNGKYILINDRDKDITLIDTFGKIGKEYLRKLENYYNRNIEMAKKLEILDLELPFNEEE